MKLSSFLDSRGVTKSSNSHNVKKKFDLESFIVHMHNCRRWSNDKSKAKFEEFKNNRDWMSQSANFDYLGESEAPLRIRFPAALLCLDYDDTVVSDFHTRQLQTSSKAEVLTDEHRSALLDDTQIGFVDDLQAPGVASLQQPTSASSVSHYGGRLSISALTLLREATSPPNSVQQDASKDAAPAQPAAAEQAQAETGPPSKKPIVDMQSKIDNQAADFKKTMKGQLARIQKEVKSSAQELVKGPALSAGAGAFYKRAEERTMCMLWWLGNRPVVTADAQIDWHEDRCLGHPVQWGKDIEMFRGLKRALEAGDEDVPLHKRRRISSSALALLAEPVGGEGDAQEYDEAGAGEGEEGEDQNEANDADPVEVATFKSWVVLVKDCKVDEPPAVSDAEVEEFAHFNTHALQAFLSTIELPMESDDLMSLQEINLIQDAIRAAKSEEAIEKAKSPWVSKQSDLLGQLVVAVSRARSDLARQNKLTESAISAAEAENKKKDEEQRLAEEQSAKLAAMKVLEKTNHETFFNIEWEKLSSAKPMPIATQDQDVQKFSKGSMLAEPFVVASCSFLDLVNAPESKVKKTLALWTAAFPKDKDTILHDNTQAPFLESHGSGEVQPLWDLLLSPEALVPAQHIIVN